MKKMILIDGNSLLHRAFHALPPLRTSKGIHTNAVYGFLNMLFKILQEEEPDYITVAFDKKGPTFRHEEYAAYKATRSKTPDELIGQFDILKDILQALNINFAETDGFEADDILGSFAKKGEEAGFFNLIITGDKDALQLVSTNTNVMLTKRGISEMEVYDIAKIREKYGISPEALVEMKGLMGDKSDNIPGVPGIGEKTAIRLVLEFGTIENVLKNIDKFKGKLKENLVNYSEQARISRYLATIVRDMSLEFDLEKTVYREPDHDKLINLFGELEFYSLVQRFQPQASIKESKIIKTVNIENVDMLRKLVKKLAKHEQIAVLVDVQDTSTMPYRISGVYLSTKDENYYMGCEILSEEQISNSLKPLLESSAIEKITHNGKFARNALKTLNIDFKYQFDTMLAAYLLEPAKSRYDISTLTVEYLGNTLTTESSFEEKTSRLIPLKNKMNKKLQDYEMQKLFYEVELPFSTVLADMEYAGIKVNPDELEKLSNKFGEELMDLTKNIYNMANAKFNINSPKQLGEILFEHLSLPVIKRTKTGYSTDAEVLEKLREHHPIVEYILEYRSLTKLKSTYADGILALVNKNTNRIYTSFNQTVTSTGRISSTEPNLQNIPVRTEVGRHIRGVFTADDPEHVLLSGDYSQIELRVLAHISQDPGLIAAFTDGEDIHTRTASEVFEVPLEEVTPSLRDRAKAVNFGIVYGISDYGLAQGLGISNQEAQEYIDAYFERYPGVRDYIRETIQSAKNMGYVTTLLNRRRYIPDINSRNYHLRSFAERAAMNTPIQGSAADIIKVAMVKVYNHLKQNNFKTKLLLQVHDEIILNVPKTELLPVKQILKQDMENAISLKVPLVVDFTQGYTWEEL